MWFSSLSLFQSLKWYPLQLACYCQVKVVNIMCKILLGITDYMHLLYIFTDGSFLFPFLLVFRIKCLLGLTPYFSPFLGSRQGRCLVSAWMHCVPRCHAATPPSPEDSVVLAVTVSTSSLLETQIQFTRALSPRKDCIQKYIMEVSNKRE